MRKQLVAAASQSYSSEATHRSRCDGISAAKRESSIAGISDLLPFLFCILVCGGSLGHAAQVPVQHKEGLIHGFLTLRNHEGEIIANGDLIQNAHGDRVMSRLIFHFKDGSIHDETTVYSQRGHFRLLSDHLIQKGPAFQHPVEMTLNTSTGQVQVRYAQVSDEKTDAEHVELPSDVANGMLLTLLKNIRPDTPETEVAFLATTPKPRLVKFVITPKGEEPFLTGDTQHKAMHFVVKVDIGRISGAFAELLGKQPADIHVWILEGEAPAFVKSEGPLAFGGPIWRLELVSPVWPHAAEHVEREKK